MLILWILICLPFGTDSVQETSVQDEINWILPSIKALSQLNENSGVVISNDGLNSYDEPDANSFARTKISNSEPEEMKKTRLNKVVSSNRVRVTSPRNAKKKTHKVVKNRAKKSKGRPTHPPLTRSDVESGQDLSPTSPTPDRSASNRLHKEKFDEYNYNSGNLEQVISQIYSSGKSDRVTQVGEWSIKEVPFSPEKSQNESIVIYNVDNTTFSNETTKRNSNAASESLMELIRVSSLQSPNGYEMENNENSAKSTALSQDTLEFIENKETENSTNSTILPFWLDNISDVEEEPHGTTIISNSSAKTTHSSTSPDKLYPMLQNTSDLDDRPLTVSSFLENKQEKGGGGTEPTVKEVDSFLHQTVEMLNQMKRLDSDVVHDTGDVDDLEAKRSNSSMKYQGKPEESPNKLSKQNEAKNTSVGHIKKLVHGKHGKKSIKSHKRNRTSEKALWVQKKKSKSLDHLVRGPVLKSFSTSSSHGELVPSQEDIKEGFFDNSADPTTENKKLYERRLNFYYIKDAEQQGAICIDGSPSGYYFRPGKDSGERKWILQLHGGAWCYDLRSCYTRSFTELGSTRNRRRENIRPYFRGMLSADQNVNRHFHNWNVAVLLYCDGGLFSGNREEPIHFQGRNLFFRGRAILESFMRDIEERGLGSASDVILAGTSAGGLSVILHADYVRSVLPNVINFKGMVDAGYFIDAKDLPGFNTFRYQMRGLYEMHLPLLDSMCVFDDDVPDKYACLMPEVALKYVRTKMFLANSLYDQWQLVEALGVSCVTSPSKCTHHDRKRIRQFRERMIHSLWKLAEKIEGLGVFAHTCIAHGQTIINNVWNRLILDGISMADAFWKWYQGDGQQNDIFRLDCYTLCNPTCILPAVKACQMINKDNEDSDSFCSKLSE